MLELRGVAGGYGGPQVLRGVTLRVAAGEFVALIGPNGAGKSTVLKAVAGVLPRVEGEIALEGRPVQGLSPRALLALGVVYLPQGRNVFPSLTVLEHLELMRDLAPHALSPEAVLERFPALRPLLGRRAGLLSGGQQQLLCLARAALASPRLLLVDEPSLGLAPRVVEDVFAALADLRGRGVSILLVEQNARRALAAADRAYVLELGRTRLEGRGRELLEDPRVAQLYLGAPVSASAP
ncbi:MAG: ATP-binding cassette domain-containing protein [Firmicutes bacterium]|nr:ATP-binding cassette domain-containing protein [Bacillota bacterium]